MTPDHIRTVQATWTRVLPVKDAAAQIFCECLRQDAPLLACLLRGDLRQRGAKFIQVIDVAVDGLGQRSCSAPLMRMLGRRYADCAVTDTHYDSIANALLGMLDWCLGPEFTPDVKVAWETVYLELVAIMREAALATLPAKTFRVQQPDLRNAP
ncbi:MAG: globin domain-containing protein [Betaproteobacteria bacterium]|jgi:hypothetical protein